MKIWNFLILLGSILSLSVLTACHTVAGAGQDVSDTGQTITHAANDTADHL